jgi:hypothetical protein
MDRIGAKTW